MGRRTRDGSMAAIARSLVNARSERTCWAEGLGLDESAIGALTLIAEEATDRSRRSLFLDPRDVWSAWPPALEEAGWMISLIECAVSTSRCSRERALDHRARQLDKRSLCRRATAPYLNRSLADWIGSWTSRTEAEVAAVELNRHENDDECDEGCRMIGCAANMGLVQP